MNIHALCAALALSLTASAATSQERTLEGAHQFLAAALGTGTGSLPAGIFDPRSSRDTAPITRYEGAQCRSVLHYGEGLSFAIDWTRVVSVTSAEGSGATLGSIALVYGFNAPSGLKASGVGIMVDQPALLPRLEAAAEFIRQSCGGSGGF